MIEMNYHFIPIYTSQTANRLRSLCLLIFIFVGQIAFAQQKLEIKVTDERHKPIPFANVAIMQKSDSSLVTGGITDTMGIYTRLMEDLNSLDSLYITVSAMGYASHKISDIKPLSFNIMLRDGCKDLPEVVVTAAQKLNAQLTNDGIYISLHGSPLAQIGNAMDLLVRLPMLTGDSKTVKVLGRGTPIIYVNGRKANNIEEIFQLKSSDIKAVKVITNPGSEYDASGTCVLKITTYKPKDESFCARLMGKIITGHNVSSEQYAFMQYRKERYDVFGSIYNIQTASPTHFEYEQDFTPKINKQVQGNILMKSRKIRQIYMTGFNFLPSESHHFGMKYTFTKNPLSRIRTQSAIQYHGEEDKTEEYHSQKNETFRSHHLNFYWSGTLSKHNSIKLDGDILDTRTGYDEHVKQGISDPNVTNGYNMKSKLYAARVVQDNDFDWGQLSFGAEASLTQNHQSFASNHTLIDSGKNYLRNTAFAGFANYSRQWEHFSTKAGLRYEYNAFDYHLNGNLQNEQSKRFHNLFPNFSMQYQGIINVQLSYRSNISRPSYSQLKSGVQYDNENLFEGGNPYLKPKISHNISLNIQKDNLMAGATYSLMSNMIYGSMTLYKDSPIIFFQSQNIKKAQNLYLFLSYEKEIGCWTPNIYLSYDKPFVKLNGTSYNTPTYSISFKNTFTLPHGINIWANYEYATPGHLETVYFKGANALSLFLSKNFLKDRLTVSLEATDVFNTTGDDYDIKQNQLLITNSTKPDTRTISLTLSYQINKKKDRYKGDESTEEINRLK